MYNNNYYVLVIWLYLICIQVNEYSQFEFTGMPVEVSKKLISKDGSTSHEWPSIDYNNFDNHNIAITFYHMFFDKNK